MSRLADAAVAIGGEAGRSGALEPRLRATLHAAALDEGVRDELAAGRLVREREPVALGVVAVDEPEPTSGSSTPAAAGRKAAEPSRTRRGRRRARAEDPAAERAGKLAELKDRVAEARERAETAASALADAERQAADARERADAAGGERKEAERAERAARKAVKEAERAERSARKTAQDAEGAKRAARKAAQEAGRAAERLEREAQRALSDDADSGTPRRRRR